MCETGNFPAACPVCAAEGRADNGRLDEQAMAFLQSRGVISRDLLFRLLKGTRAATRPRLPPQPGLGFLFAARTPSCMVWQNPVEDASPKWG